MVDLRLPEMGDREFLTAYGFSRNSPNTTMQWHGSDIQSRWTANRGNSKMRKRLLGLGWTDSNVEYRFNNHGFRSDDDFDIDDPAPGNMFLGCSLTEGTGLNIEDTWAYRVNRMLGGTFYNLGQGATGIETQYRLMRAWAPIVRPRAIYTLGAIGPRREILRDGSPPVMVGPWMEDDEIGDTERGLLCDIENTVSTLRTVDAMRCVAASTGIPLYVPTGETNDRARIAYTKSGDYARDGMHPGRSYHKEISRDLRGWRRLA